MFTYTLRRLLIAIPTVLVISLVIFMLLELAPGDPMADVPLTVPPEVKAKMREALGLDQPSWVRYLLWLKQFFWVEPLHLIDHWFGTHFGEGMQRVISWQTRSPVSELILQRLPQTLWVVGMGYLVGVSLAVPIGV
ncbi:MAG: ABC transporter permease, partial [Rhodoferax sp.]|nr:ABC transporter permease [Rhodoferax sp.]